MYYSDVLGVQFVDWCRSMESDTHYAFLRYSCIHYTTYYDIPSSARSLMALGTNSLLGVGSTMKIRLSEVSQFGVSYRGMPFRLDTGQLPYNCVLK
jgi:hypothetical protein